MRWRTVRWALIAPLLLAGCAPRHAETPGAGTDWDTPDPDPELARWPWWPVRARFHPLTRLVYDDPGAPGKILIEARCEFLDRDGSSSRGSGRLRMDLHDAQAGGEGDPLASWSADLRDVPTNTQHWDPVMRTYLLRLEVEPALIPAQPAMRLYFLSADGTRLTAEVELRREEESVKSPQRPSTGQG